MIPRTKTPTLATEFTHTYTVLVDLPQFLPRFSFEVLESGQTSSSRDMRTRSCPRTVDRVGRLTVVEAPGVPCILGICMLRSPTVKKLFKISRKVIQRDHSGTSSNCGCLKTTCIIAHVLNSDRRHAKLKSKLSYQDRLHLVNPHHIGMQPRGEMYERRC